MMSLSIHCTPGLGPQKHREKETGVSERTGVSDTVLPKALRSGSLPVVRPASQEASQRGEDRLVQQGLPGMTSLDQPNTQPNTAFNLAKANE